MVVQNKANRVVRKFRDTVVKQLLGASAAKKQVIRKKVKILEFFLKNGQWPSRKAKSRIESRLGAIFENLVCKSYPSHDKNLRRISLATGRAVNNKRKHDVAGFKKEILAFVKEHNRVPSTNRENELTEGEARLRHRLDYYTNNCNDMTLLGQVYDGDPCHRSGIPAKYRAIINEALTVKKPLIRLV